MKKITPTHPFLKFNLVILLQYDLNEPLEKLFTSALESIELGEEDIPFEQVLQIKMYKIIVEVTGFM